MKTALIAAVLTAGAVLIGVGLADTWHQRAVEANYQAGHAAAQAACRIERLEAVTAAEAQVRNEMRADIEAAQANGQVREVVRTRIETKFITLRKDAARAPADPVDRCELPAERLRRWQDANAAPAGGTGDGAAAGQPGASAASAPGAGVRPDAGPGAQPSGRDRGLSPAREPGVRADRLRHQEPRPQGLRAMDGDLP